MGMKAKIEPRSRTWVALPLPPSVNNLFATVGNKRVKTKQYKAWLSDALTALVELKKPAPGKYRIWVVVGGDVDQQRDLDNMLKPIGDVLVAAGIIPGDTVRHVVGWVVDYRAGADDPLVSVRVESRKDVNQLSGEGS